MSEQKRTIKLGQLVGVIEGNTTWLGKVERIRLTKFGMKLDVLKPGHGVITNILASNTAQGRAR